MLLADPHAALRDFSPAYVSFGSMSALHPKADIRFTLWHLFRAAPQYRLCNFRLCVAAALQL